MASIFDQFDSHGIANTDAFEELCCQLFDSWGTHQRGFKEPWRFRDIRGAGGDGGIEAYWHNVDTDEWIGLQAKWFPKTLKSSQLNQIKDSVEQALEIRPTMKHYIVCIPHDLTSSKNVRGNKISNGEDSDWDTFKQEVCSEHSGLNLELWDEHKIFSLLQLNENEGCWRFWFEKVNPENIYISLAKTLARIEERYTPEITKDGGLAEFLDHFLGTTESRRSFLRNIDSYITTANHVIGEIDSFLALEGQRGSQLDAHACACRSSLTSYTDSLSSLRESIIVEPGDLLNLDAPDISYASIEEFQDDITSMERQRSNTCHAEELNKALNSFRELPVLWDVYRLASDTVGNSHCIIMGNQGTGKTCGLARKAQEYLDAHQHVPILILATEIQDTDSWAQVVKRALGLGDDWDEAALWQALSAYAATYDVTNEDLYIRAKAAIMVDGLDENPPASNWEKRLREGDAISAKFPRIRFAYTSRPWGVDFKDRSLLRSTYYIDEGGDVPAWKLFDQYIEHFKVDLAEDNRYKWLLDTPSELRMFCEAYRDRTLPGQVPTCLTKLTQEEIKRLDEEFASRTHALGPFYQPGLVSCALRGLSVRFLNNDNPASKQEIGAVLDGADVPKSYHMPLIDLLTRYGILSVKHIQGNSPFDPPVLMYSPGSRHLWDYFMAYSLLMDESSKSKNLLSKNRNAAYMYGVLLIEKKGILPCNSNELTEAVGKYEAREINLYALAHATPSKAAKFHDWAFNELEKGGGALFDIVNDIVLPVANVANHPLGPLMLDEYLGAFNSPAARDAIWSLPTSIRNGGRTDDPRASLYSERQLVERMPTLHGFEAAFQMPLVLAWGLSSLSNLKRRHCSGELVMWGRKNPAEFARLFTHFCRCNDPQIREDMFAIAEEVVCQGQVDVDTERILGKATLDSIFRHPDEPGNRDAALRFYGRLLVERCYREKLLSDTEVTSCRPPYKVGTPNTALPIFADASTATSMNGYYPIHYDLARYVLVDHLSSAFEIPRSPSSRHKNNSAIDSVMAASAAQTGTSEIPDFQGWVIAAAYQYLLDHGYEPEKFEGPLNEKSYRTGGLDGRITRAFYHADHGARSTVMTVAEKYVWCARNEICGYLADRIAVRSEPWMTSNSYSTEEGLATDYGMLLDFDSPLFEAMEYYFSGLRHDDTPVFPQPFACHEDEPCPLDELETWIRGTVPECATSLLDYSPNSVTEIAHGTIPLALYARDWGTCGKETAAWIRCGAINLCELSALDDAQTAWIDGYRDSSSFEVSFDTSGSVSYISPVEALSAPWEKEYDEADPVDMVADAHIHAMPLSGEGVTNLTDIGDFYYLFPSKLARDICHSSSTDGFRYYDKDGNTLFEYIQYGTEYRHEYHALLADRETLLQGIKTNNLELIWYATVQREPNALARERIPDIKSQEAKSWLIWSGKDDKYHSVAVSDEEVTPNYQPGVEAARNIIDKLFNEHENEDPE